MAKSQNKESKDEKDKDALVGRIRKVVKKSRRKLGEEKFEKELQRTISFLTELRDRLKDAPAKDVKPTKPAKPAKTLGNGKDHATNQKTSKLKPPVDPVVEVVAPIAKVPVKPKSPVKVKAAK